jgi:AcrR family transcriptional regulator
MDTEADTSPRLPLRKDRILHAAVDLADREGLGALTMRRLGAELGVEAMSLYKHVTNKEGILDGVVEVVIGEIEVPRGETDWKEAMRLRAVSARQVLSRHSWAIGLLENRGAMGPTVMRYVNAILGSLRSAGFSVEDAAHAFWLLDSYVYGHVIHEASVSSRPDEASVLEETSMDEFPHLAEVAEDAARSTYSVDREFEFGLELILEALDERREPRGDGVG